MSLDGLLTPRETVAGSIRDDQVAFRELETWPRRV